jgi:hypothetical protein
LVFYAAANSVLRIGGVVAYAIGLAERAFWHIWLFQENGQPSCIDFTTMWVSGIFAGSSDPARMYDDSAWAAAWKSLTGLEGCSVYAVVVSHTAGDPSAAEMFRLGNAPT